MPGDSNYLSQHFRQTASLGLLEAKGTSRLAVEVQDISSTLRSVYAWEADVCYPLRHGSWNLATLLLKKDVGNRCIHLRYTGVQAQCLHMLFPQPIPATNIRRLAGTYSQAGCGRVLPCPQLSQESMPRSQLSTSCILMTV